MKDAFKACEQARLECTAVVVKHGRRSNEYQQAWAKWDEAWRELMPRF